MLSVQPQSAEGTAKESEKPSRRFAVISILAAAALFAPIFLHGNELIDHMPSIYTVLGAAIGFGVGVFIDYKAAAGLLSRGARGYVAMTVPPLFGILIGTHYSRLIYEEAAFISTKAEIRQMATPVTSFRHGRYGITWGYVIPGDDARKLQIKITGDLYDRLDPYRHPGRDCLLMHIQTGRWGVRRAILPAPINHGVDVDDLRRCDILPSEARL